MKILSNFLLILTLVLFFPNVVLAHTKVEHKVIINDSNFVPDTLEITQGDTVVFINKGKNPHWPASNIHPSHEIYPEFDPKVSLEAGKEWSFSFEKSGSFRFHDHIYPKMTGVINIKKDQDFKVQETPKPNFKQKLSNRFKDLKTDLTKLYYRFFPQELDIDLAKFKIQEEVNNDESMAYWLKVAGGRKLMKKLVADTGGGSIIDCHQEAHKLGRTAYELFGAEVFKSGHYGCHSGYYHGAMEIFLREKGTDNLAEDIKKLCSEFSTSFGNFECLHGVGHGVLAYLDYDLEKAIKTCQKLDSSFAQASCFGGMFMENIVVAQGRGAKHKHQTSWVSSDPHFPCNKIDQSLAVQTQCYLMQTSRMLDIYGYQFPPVVEQCLKAPKDMRSTCFQSIGRDGAGQRLRDPEKTLAICNNTPKEYFNNCADGGLNVIIDFWGEGITDQAINFCKLIKEDSKAHCFTLVGQRLANVFGSDTAKIKNICALDDSYQKVCLQSANVI